MTSRRRKGFTIVELLIVIVVVAVLAAISIVAYTGVQRRAEDSAQKAEAKVIGAKLREYNVLHESFPERIDDCPAPADGNLCLGESDYEVRYKKIDTYSYGNSAESWVKPGYSIGVMGDSEFLFHATMEQRGRNEFNRTVDLAPYFDKYGTGTYLLSFDLRSEDISSRSYVQAYLQNGGNTRYSFSVPVTATTDYKRYTIEVTPSGPNEAVQQAYLAFYGIYDTGNVPVVKNITLQKK